MNFGGYSSAQAAATVNFLYWIINDGQSLGTGLGYAALPANIIAIDNTSLLNINYNGTPVI